MGLYIGYRLHKLQLLNQKVYEKVAFIKNNHETNQHIIKKKIFKLFTNVKNLLRNLCIGYRLQQSLLQFLSKNQ